MSVIQSSDPPSIQHILKPTSLGSGLAVAEDGRRIFIVGGRACLGDGSRPCSRSDKTANFSLTAEIFELDLGTAPLTGWTAHWRQVSFRIHSEVGVEALATAAKL